MVLNFSLREQTLTAQRSGSTPRIGSREYLTLNVTPTACSDSLEGFTHTVYFQHDEYSTGIVVDDLSAIKVPDYFTQQSAFAFFLVSIKGETVIPTNVVTVALEHSGEVWEVLPPTPDIPAYQQLVNLAEQSKAAAVEAAESASSAQHIAQSVRDDADSGKFDGFSPTVTFTPVANGTMVTITDKNCEHYAVIENGQPGERGPQGQPGQPGADGEDGFSPVVTLVQLINGVRITITDKQGEHTAVVYNGAGGDPTTLIDDESVALNKTWSAKKLGYTTEQLSQAIEEVDNVLTPRVESLEQHEIQYINQDGSMTPAQLHALGTGIYYLVQPIQRMSGNIGAQGLTSIAGEAVNNFDFGHYFDDFNGTSYANYGSIDGFGIKEATPMFTEIEGKISALDARIDEVELFKFPNVVIIGEPTISHGQISDFSATNYLRFPFLVDFYNRQFVINMAFTTGADVTTQQNILDSEFGLAFAVANSKFEIAISTNGTSWNLGATFGTYQVRPNTTYYSRISWNRLQYKVEYSLDRVNYTQDIAVVATQSPYPKQMLIGVGDLGKSVVHVFKGTINLNYANLSIADELVWQGMDDAGLATRADISLSNLDAKGEQRFTQLKEDLAQKLTEPSGAQVGQFFRVASIDADGHYVLEAVDAPSGGVTDVTVAGESVVNNGVAVMPLATNSKSDVYGVINWQAFRGLTFNNGALTVEGGVPSTRRATPGYGYGPIMSGNLDEAVRLAICDGRGPAWTAEEQAAARARMGLEWELIEEITFAEDITALTRNTEPNGTPYKFRGMRIAISANGVMPTTTDLGWIRYNNAKGYDNWIYNAPRFYGLQRNSIYVGEVIRNGNGYWEEWDFRGSNDNTNMGSSIQRSVGNMIWHNTNDISDFYLYSSNILAGMKMFIFAMR